jgi:hypothetical protein
MNELTISTFRTVPTGKLTDAEREALAFTLIEMTGVADSSDSKKLFLPAVRQEGKRRVMEAGKKFMSIMFRHLNLKGIRLRMLKAYSVHKSSVGFQKYFKLNSGRFNNTFVTNSAPQTNQTTGL